MKLSNLAWISVAIVVLTVDVALAAVRGDQMIQISDKEFVPDKVEITAGQKVIFQNLSQKDHTVTSTKPAGKSPQDKDKTGFDSGPIKPNALWEHRFSTEGTYTYSCKEDPSMIGTIVVKSAK